MTDNAAILGTRARLPDHVAYRNFGEETVVVNLKSGKYHGLNHSALCMLENVTESPSVGAAIPQIAAQLGAEPERVEQDLVELCRGLRERGLVELS